MAAELRNIVFQKCDTCKVKDATKRLIDGVKYLGSFCAPCGKKALEEHEANNG